MSNDKLIIKENSIVEKKDNFQEKEKKDLSFYYILKKLIISLYNDKIIMAKTNNSLGMVFLGSFLFYTTFYLLMMNIVNKNFYFIEWGLILLLGNIFNMLFILFKSFILGNFTQNNMKKYFAIFSFNNCFFLLNIFIIIFFFFNITIMTYFYLGVVLVIYEMMNIIATIIISKQNKFKLILLNLFPYVLYYTLLILIIL
ncbi:MAG: hypothetical protein ACOCRX_04490 [Candidatus Woesearchaeota archaeon]